MALEQDIQNLARIPILAELEPEALRLIAFSSDMRILRAGDILFRKGEASYCGYVVMRGSVALVSTNASAPAAQVAEQFTLIGEIALISQTVRPATAIAREASTVLRIPRSLFHRVLKEFPRSAASLRPAIAARLKILADELEDLLRRSFEAQV